MGRTLPTATQLIDQFETEWRGYARVLRKEDQAVLADLFAMVRMQLPAIAYASPSDPFQAFTLAMLGGLLKRMIQLEEKVRVQQGECAQRVDDEAA